MRPLIATICSSTAQREDIEQLAKRLTLSGLIVFSPNVFIHRDGSNWPRVEAEDKLMLDGLHLEKIKLSDIVYFIYKPGGHFGESTSNERKFAQELSKAIIYTDPEAIWDPSQPIPIPAPIQRRRWHE